MRDDSPGGTSVENLLRSIDAEDNGHQPGAGDDAVPGQEKKKKDKDKGPGSNRGIETLFRVTYENNMQLIKLADNKANTLIGINGMIISVIIALVSPRIELNTWLMAPSVILLLGCLSSLTLSILASRPRLLSNEINMELVLKNDVNLLFFGNFTRLPQQEFLRSMDHLMTNRRLLYDNMIRDIYSMGLVLTRKYHFLRYSYLAFLVTLALAVLVFVAVFYLLGTA